MTSYAAALVVSSYDERVFGRVNHPDQKRRREAARDMLLHSISLLADAKRDTGETKTGAKQLFERGAWDDSLASARATLRGILDTPN